MTPALLTRRSSWSTDKKEQAEATAEVRLDSLVTSQRTKWTEDGRNSCANSLRIKKDFQCQIFLREPVRDISYTQLRFKGCDIDSSIPYIVFCLNFSNSV